MTVALQYSHYTKPTQTMRVISYETHAPQNIKLGSLKSEVKRVARNTQKHDELVPALLQVKRKYSLAGYPLLDLDRICNVHWATSTKRPFNQLQYCVSLPYLGQTSDRINSVLQSFHVRVVPMKQNTLANLLMHSSVRPVAPPTTHMVYALPCAACPSMYIGQTSRGVQRLKEHLSDVEHSRVTSSVYQHF